MKKEIPKLECKGCKSRDELIRKLSLRIDELERSKKEGTVRPFRGRIAVER